MAYSGILWHTLAYSGIHWHTLAYSGILWHTLAYSCILWHTLAYSGTPWHILAYSGILWHTLAYSGIISASSITADGAYHCPVGSIWPFLAPSGALIAIPTYYWSSTHFFRSHRSSTLDFHFLSHYSYI